MGSKVSESSDAGTGTADKADLIKLLEYDAKQRRRRPVFSRISAGMLDWLAKDEAAEEAFLADLRAGGERAGRWVALHERIRRRKRSTPNSAFRWLQEGKRGARALLRQIGLSAVEAKVQLASELADPRVLAAIQAREKVTTSLADSVLLLGATAFPSPETFAAEVRQIATAWNAGVAHTDLIARICPRCGAPAEGRHRRSNYCSQACQSRDRDEQRRASRKQKWATKPEPPRGIGPRRRDSAR